MKIRPLIQETVAITIGFCWRPEYRGPRVGEESIVKSTAWSRAWGCFGFIKSPAQRTRQAPAAVSAPGSAAQRLAEKGWRWCFTWVRVPCVYVGYLLSTTHIHAQSISLCYHVYKTSWTCWSWPGFAGVWFARLRCTLKPEPYAALQP